MTPYEHPRLIADIGGQYAHFALERAAGQFEHAVDLRCADHADLQAAVGAYLAGIPAPRPVHAAISIANPVDGDEVRLTHCPWQFSIERTRQQLALETLVVVNDFTALAMALPRLSHQDMRRIGGGEARPNGVIGLLGAGSGLGMSGLIPTSDGHVALGGEGGHVTVSPRDARERAIVAFAARENGHVSFERLLSGPGLALIHRALRHGAGLAPDPLEAPDITRRGLDGSDPLCREALDAFCALLGTAAANLTLTLGAIGGLYIGGAIVPRLGAYFDTSPFRSRFEDHGHHSAYLAGIPTFVVTAGHATLLGASAILSEQLRGRHRQNDSALLDQILRARDSLSPAERRVADQVLAHPRAALNDPVAAIARAAAVSQPTVIRFCRRLGCQGLPDFKRRLAASLTGTVPVTHTQVTSDDTMLELGVKVLSNSAAAVLQLRDQLNRETVDRAIDLLTTARRVEFYAAGHSSVVAHDAQFKFLRFGVVSNAITDPRLHRMAAQVLQPGDVAVIVSSSGRVDDLIAVAEVARERGAAVLAITASHSPLARRADVTLIVDHQEDTATHVPMVSRILHLLVVDILSVGVAMRRGAPQGQPQESPLSAGENPPSDAASPSQPPQRVARPPAPGSSAVTPLSHLTSHSR